MQTDRGLRFWQRFAALYDLFMRKDAKAYDALSERIRGELKAGMDVLELATGTGMVAQRVAGSCKAYLATDYSEKMLEEARRKNWPDNVTFGREDAMALSFPDESFDVVIVANALHIMPDPSFCLPISGACFAAVAS